MAQQALAPAKKTLIEKHLEQGWPHRKIAREVGVAHGTVSNVRRGLLDEPKKRADPTNQRINDLEGKLHSIQSERAHLKQQLKASQVNAINFKTVLADMERLIKPLLAPKSYVLPKGKAEYDEDAVLLLSDGHMDCEVRADGTQGLEEYNFNVAMARAERLVDTVIEISHHTMANYKFPRLWIFNLGDMVHGEIHDAIRHTHFHNPKKAALAAGQLLGQMICNLAEWFPEIRIVCLSGNHGRDPKSGKKDYAQPLNNWDYMVSGIANLYCRDIENVHFQIPNSFTAIVEVRGHNFHLSHGDGIQSQLGIPYYGVQRKALRLISLAHLQDLKLKAICIGHFHIPYYEQRSGVETFINGAWLGTDPFAYGACDGFNDPIQWFFGVNKHRVTFRFPLSIKFPGDVKGAKRYKMGVTE